MFSRALLYSLALFAVTSCSSDKSKSSPASPVPDKSAENESHQEEGSAVTPDPAADSEAPMDAESVSPLLVRLSDGLLKEGDRWELHLVLSFENVGDATIEIDKETACDEGKIRNAVFRVTADGEEISYTGVMRKRAHPGPDGFHKLKPGETHKVKVELGADYPLPANVSEVAVTFEHFNHFSKDALDMKSNTLVVRP